jgi:hypothetical protein
LCGGRLEVFEELVEDAKIGEQCSGNETLDHISEEVMNAVKP